MVKRTASAAPAGRPDLPPRHQGTQKTIGRRDIPQQPPALTHERGGADENAPVVIGRVAKQAKRPRAHHREYHDRQAIQGIAHRSKPAGCQARAEGRQPQAYDTDR